MIKQIIKDQFFLNQKSQEASLKDIETINDLLDTIKAHPNCIGIAANMIGVLKNIIVFKENSHYTVMINPQIISTSKNTYKTNERCLCHQGVKETIRYQKVKVQFIDINGKKKIKTYQEQTAQIIQHEIDHCYGILI